MSMAHVYRYVNLIHLLQTPRDLLIASMKGDVEEILACLEAGVYVDCRDEVMCTCMSM